MSAELAVAAVALGAVFLYALFGGADFGGGVWDALASGPRRAEQREAIGHAIGPVWETNHVWLIFLIVICFTCFPPAFAALATGLYVPLTFVLVGIILRGAAYAFRAQADNEGQLGRLWGHLFGIASIIAPFFFGTAVGALTAGDYVWYAPFALCIGMLAVSLCTQVAAIFLIFETQGALREDYRIRAITATFVLAATGAIALAVARITAPQIFAGLTRPSSLAGIAVAMSLGFVVLGATYAHRFAIARIAVAAEVLAVLCGWYAAQAPYLVPHQLTYEQAAAPPATLHAFLILTAIGTAVLVPSLALLFKLFKSAPPSNPNHRRPSASHPQSGCKATPPTSTP